MFTVFGSSGFIGSHLARVLAQRGLPYAAPARGDDTWRDKPLGHVIYAIGLTADFRSRPFDTVEAHVSLLADVLSHAQFDTFTYLSSTRVYRGSTDAREETALRVDPASADDLYNLSKLMGESLVHVHAGPRARVLRLANVYGGDWGADNFLASIVRDAVTRRSVVIRTSPGSSKDYVAIEDVVSLLIDIALRGTHTVYNIASGQAVTNAALAAALAQAADCPVTFEPNAATVSFPAIDIRRVREEFGAPRASLLQDLPRLVTDCRNTLSA